MGKKGKHRGLTKVEADRIRAAASRNSIVDRRYAVAGPEATRRTAAPKTELQKLREERGTVSLTHLRGLLRDRQREDTLEYQQARRRQMTANVRVEASNRKKEQSADESDAASAKRHEPGWLLYHGGEESKSGSPGPPTLQSLCVASIGPVISEYLDAFGVDVLSSIFSSLPSNVLKELSVKVSECKGVDDALVQALGSHSHVEALALHSAAGPKRVTAAGILSIVPRVCTGNNDVDERIQESWEDADQTLHIEGCSQIRRLELCNLMCLSDDEDTDYECAVRAEQEMEDALLSLFSLCGRITHLSLGASFRSHPHRLFQSLPVLLPSLQVLDLSCCVWIDDAVLISLLRAIALECRGCTNLALVDVSSCPSITEKGVSLANEMAYCMLGGVKNIVQQ